MHAYRLVCHSDLRIIDARAGRIRAHVERFSLDDVPQAYESLRAGRLEGRAGRDAERGRVPGPSPFPEQRGLSRCSFGPRHGKIVRRTPRQAAAGRASGTRGS